MKGGECLYGGHIARENRVICLLLCLATVLSLLGGCGKAPVATQPETTAPETTEAPTQATEATGLYRSYQMIWFYYYVSRQTACPIVLTENGFMSNPDDVTNMLTEEALDKKADALVQGIVNYYLELSGYEPKQ